MPNKRNLLFLIAVAFLISCLSAKDYKGAEYRTKLSYQYGRFEVSMKSAQRPGVVSTFFTYFDGLPNDEWSSGKWSEIDIEIIGRYQNDVQLNTITAGQINHVSHIWTDFNPATDFHVYAFEWTPTYVAWFIDGVEVRRQTGDHITPLKAQKIMMNTWMPDFPNWVGDFIPEYLPAFTYYDWVSYSKYTPGSGTTGSSNNFTPEWKDEFNTFDSDRWEKATHTFGGNNVDFIAENAVFQNGLLILSVTNSTNTGLADFQKPKVVSAKLNGDKINVKFNKEIEKLSSETKTNFIVPGLTVNSAVLLPDNITVQLSVTGAQTGTDYNVITQKIKDRALSPNTIDLASKSVTGDFSLPLPIKINTGTTKFVSDYSPDQVFTPSSEYGYYDGSLASITANTPISNTDSPEIYRTEHSGHSMYQVRIAPAIYKVTLMFSENYFSDAGKRVMDVTVENSENAVRNIDLFSLAGKNSAYNLIFQNIKVTDGILDIHFSAVLDLATVSGIQIEKTGEVTGIKTGPSEIRNLLELNQNYPNPFNSSTQFSYSLSQPDNLEFIIYNLEGREVAKKSIGNKPSGSFLLSLDELDIEKSLSSGVYIFSIRGSNFSEFKKMTLLK